MDRPRGVNDPPVSEENPPPHRPWVVPLVIFALNAAFLAFFAVRGGLARLSPGLQFYFGASTCAFPIILYFILF